MADSRLGDEYFSTLLEDEAVAQTLKEGFLRGQQGIPMVSVPVVSDSLQELVLVMEAPVQAGDDVQAVVLAVASLRPIHGMTEERTEGGLFEVYVVDNRGWLIAHSDPEMVLGTEISDMSDSDIVRLFLKAEPRTDRAYCPVPDKSGWRVVMRIEEERAYHEARRVGDWSLLIGLAVSIVGIGVSLRFRQRRSVTPASDSASDSADWASDGRG